MKYTAFLKLYDLKDTPETRTDWLASEWSKGRLYLQDGEYYCTIKEPNKMNIISTAQAMSEKLKEMTTSQLIEEFIMTGKNSENGTPTIRAWIVYELERRDPEAFRAWLDSEDYADDESVKNYFN